MKDARHNATLNDVKNTEYIAGPAEKVLGAALTKWAAEGTAVVGVCDPPRAGMHKKVVRALRECKSLERLVCVSCNYKSWIDNAVHLCGEGSSNSIFVMVHPDAF